MAHAGLPRPTPFMLSKASLLETLLKVDRDPEATARVLRLETDFRHKIGQHVESLPTNEAKFAKFFTNPFVLMFHSMKKAYRHVSQIEQDILPAKVFSSMETSAGRMVESVVLPVYGWDTCPSEMHSCNSALDGKQLTKGLLRLVTLKSGPRCLNDEMSENFADAIISNAVAWARAAGTNSIDFTYGVLYGTKRQSNKKDWHILRNIQKKLPSDAVTLSPSGRWDCEFSQSGVTVHVTIRIGIELWNWIARHETAFGEICAALIRACITPSETEPPDRRFAICDLGDIISLQGIPAQFNVSILQRSQLEWLFFLARHFCDSLTHDLA